MSVPDGQDTLLRSGLTSGLNAHYTECHAELQFVDVTLQKRANVFDVGTTFSQGLENVLQRKEQVRLKASKHAEKNKKHAC